MLCDVSLFLYSPELAVVFIVPEFTKPSSLDKCLSRVNDKVCRGLQIVGFGIRL